MSKKVLAFLVAVAMIMSMIPTMALAATTPVIAVSNATLNAGESATVYVSISDSGNTAFTAIYLELETDEAITVNSVALSEEASTAGFTMSKVGTTYQIDGESFDGTVANNINLLDVTISVTDDAANGTYSIKVKPASDNAGNIKDATPATVDCTFTSGTVTVGSTVSDAAYTAALSTTTAEVTNGEAVSVTLTVGGTAANYNAGEITISYPSNILSYSDIETSSDEISVDSTTTGKLYIVDKGGVNNSGTTYTLKFNSTASGTGNVTIDAASFGTRTESETGNLNEAELTTASVGITVNAKTYAVTFPADTIVTGNDLFESTQTPTAGEDFKFTATNNNYTYSNVVVKVGETADTATEITGFTGNQANGWTVPGASITDNLYVTATATPNQYDVKYSYEDANGTTQSGTCTDKATYGTNYTYTMPDGVAASGAVDGFHYEVDSATIGGTATDKYSQNVTDKTVTVTGTAITGEVVITLKKVTDSADSWAVAVEPGEGITTSEYSVASSVKKGETISLTIIPAAGYKYTVTAKNTDDGTEVALTQNGNVWTTAAGVTENITFVITRTVDTTSLNVDVYLEGGMGTSKDQSMYLVKIGSKLTDKHYTCNGNAMFWSDKYSAYCYLVISATAPTAKTLTFTIADGAATEVSYDMDVNESANDTVDANDAQLAYDMYNKYYNVTTDNVTVWKFLKADVNGDTKLDTNDAAAIVNAVLTRMKG